MEQQPSEMKNEISDTRSQLENTIEALAYKANVPARAKEALHDKVDAVKDAISDASDGTQAALNHVRETVSNAGSQFQKLPNSTQGNPLALTIGSIAIGFAIGSLLPATKFERERIGGVRDQVTEAVKTKANDLVEQGKSAISQKVADVINAAKSPNDYAAT